MNNSDSTTTQLNAFTTEYQKLVLQHISTMSANELLTHMYQSSLKRIEQLEKEKEETDMLFRDVDMQAQDMAKKIVELELMLEADGRLEEPYKEDPTETRYTELLVEAKSMAGRVVELETKEDDANLRIQQLERENSELVLRVAQLEAEKSRAWAAAANGQE